MSSAAIRLSSCRKPVHPSHPIQFNSTFTSEKTQNRETEEPRLGIGPCLPSFLFLPSDTLTYICRLKVPGRRRHSHVYYLSKSNYTVARKSIRRSTDDASRARPTHEKGQRTLSPPNPDAAAAELTTTRVVTAQSQSRLTLPCRRITPERCGAPLFRRPPSLLFSLVVTPAHQIPSDLDPSSRFEFFPNPIPRYAYPLTSLLALHDSPSTLHTK